MSESFSFVHDSDLHFRALGPRDLKKDHVEKILKADPDFVIVTGDLTDDGYDGVHLGCWKYGGTEDQLTPLKKDYVHPLEEAAIPVYLDCGNHDRGRQYLTLHPYQPVRGYVARRHGGTQYKFKYQGVLFICCDEYPKDLKWLKEQLKPDMPTILFFHFNLLGPWSDWWNEKEKEAFYQVIQSYPIVALLVGHHHVTLSYKWNSIPVISSANECTLLTYLPSERKLERKVL